MTEECSNNEAAYESVIAELELALQIPIEELTIYGDSKLIVKELRREYVVRKVSLVPYRADYLMSQFRRVNIFHVQREEICNKRRPS